MQEEHSFLTGPQNRFIRLGYENFFQVQPELSFQSTTKNNFLINNHYKTVYGSVRSECSFCRVDSSDIENVPPNKRDKLSQIPMFWSPMPPLPHKLTPQQSVILALRTHTGLKQILFHPVKRAHLSLVSLGHIWQSDMSCVQKTRPYGDCDYQLSHLRADQTQINSPIEFLPISGELWQRVSELTISF